MDISASEKIWEFFNKYDINGRRAGVGLNELETAVPVTVYPNPMSEAFQFTCSEFDLDAVNLLDASGRKVELNSVMFDQNDGSINVSYLPSGLYFLELISLEGRVVVKEILKK